MAGSIIVTTSDLGHWITKYSVAWTSDSGGNVNGVSFPIKTGRLLQSKYVPGGTAPTDLYDVTLVDADGADILLGAGANQSATVAAFVAPANPVVVEGGNVTPTIANAGNAKTGILNLYVL